MRECVCEREKAQVSLCNHLMFKDIIMFSIYCKCGCELGIKEKSIKTKLRIFELEPCYIQGLALWILYRKS